MFSKAAGVAPPIVDYGFIREMALKMRRAVRD